MKMFPLKIKTKSNYVLCAGLVNNKKYTLIGMFVNPLTNSGMSINIVDENDVASTYDSSFFRLNSIKASN